MPECMPSAPIMPPPRIMRSPCPLDPSHGHVSDQVRGASPLSRCHRRSHLQHHGAAFGHPAVCAPAAVGVCACCCIIGPCCAVAAVPPHARMKADVASIRTRFCILTSSDMHPGPISTLYE